MAKKITIRTDVCFECGSEKEVSQHHVVPRARGGKRTLPLCGKCHGNAHHRKKQMNTSSLVKAAFKKKLEAGEWTSGSPPFGWKLVGRKLAIHPEEQQVRRYILELVSKGFSRREIVRILNAKNAFCRGSKWHKTSVQRIVKPRLEEKLLIQYFNLDVAEGSCTEPVLPND